MTGSDVFESPAVRVLLELERLECRLELDQAGRLHVSPRSRIPGALLDKLPEVTDELKLLVRICDDGTQERVESFKRQLADTPADQIPSVPLQAGCALRPGLVLLVRHGAPRGSIRSLSAVQSRVAPGRTRQHPARAGGRD